ncbi:hypothetical protein BH11BAC5_BH11BAC5_43890 [soil metagenome]
MNKIKNLCRVMLVTGAAIVFTSAVSAQRGRGGDRGGGGGRSDSRGGGMINRGYSNNSRGYQGGSVYRGGGSYSNNYRGYRGGGIYRGGNIYSYRPSYGYRPAYGYGRGYYNNYFPAYRYHPIYRSYGFSHFGPSFGFRLSILPFGYYPFYIGSNPYYYYDGIYYRPYSDGGYEVVEPPLGATVKHLPSGAKATVINGQKYYELGGTYYQEELTSNNKVQYVVVGTDGVINTIEPEEDQVAPPAQPNNNQNDYAPPANAPDPSAQQQLPERLTQLPANSKVVTINQQKFYLSPSGTYYQEITDANNNVSYEAVGSNDAPNNNSSVL